MRKVTVLVLLLVGMLTGPSEVTERKSSEAFRPDQQTKQTGCWGRMDSDVAENADTIEANLANVLPNRKVTMRNIRPPDDLDWDWAPEYYFLDPNKVVRIVHDDDLDECTISEAMGREGVWFDCDVDQVLADGRPITEAEARELVDSFGGDW